jgi:hypothetical protein
MPGFFYDAGSSDNSPQAVPPGPVPQVPANNYYYDADPSNDATALWKTYFDFLEMRGFFVIEVPNLQENSWGAFYDGDNADPKPFPSAYDAGPSFASFYDGSATGQSNDYRALWAAVNAAKAGGVTFDLVETP